MKYYFLLRNINFKLFVFNLAYLYIKKKNKFFYYY